MINSYNKPAIFWWLVYPTFDDALRKGQEEVDEIELEQIEVKEGGLTEDHGNFLWLRSQREDELVWTQQSIEESILWAPWVGSSLFQCWIDLPFPSRVFCESIVFLFFLGVRVQNHAASYIWELVLTCLNFYSQQSIIFECHMGVSINGDTLDTPIAGCFMMENPFPTDGWKLGLSPWLRKPPYIWKVVVWLAGHSSRCSRRHGTSWPPWASLVLAVASQFRGVSGWSTTNGMPRKSWDLGGFPRIFGDLGSVIWSYVIHLSELDWDILAELGGLSIKLRLNLQWWEHHQHQSNKHISI